MVRQSSNGGSNRHAIDAYADAVVAGSVLAGKYHRLACARHQRDRAREGAADFPFRLDLARADRFLSFGELLKHYKGDWAGQHIRWQPQQIFRLGSLFGWVRVDTGVRRYRHAYNELPRKQGKSLETAVVGLYATFFDGESGAEGYCAATKKDQARIVFGDCKRLVLQSRLRDRIRVLQSNLSRESTSSKLEPLGADEDSLDGLNPHFVSLDEIHKYKSRAMIDVLETATGARAQPIIYKITTAGDDLNSACGDEHKYACSVLDGSLVDESYFAFIAHADVDDDWTSADTARKANPNYGVSVNPADLAAKVVKARGMPAAKATYQQKHLNLWVNVSQPWLGLDGWRRGQSTPGSWELADLAGRPCLVGVDLSAKLDLTALVVLFPPVADESWRVVPYVWTPADTMADRAHRDRAPYPQWRDDGYLRTTPGTRVDHQVIRDALAELRTVVDIRAIGFDPWHADQLIVQLTQTDGFATDQVVEVAQTYKGMSSGCKSLEAAVLAGQVDARRDPLLEWAVGNAVVQRDGKDNIYPIKKRSRGRIDPLMALCVAWSIALKAIAPSAPQIHV